MFDFFKRKRDKVQVPDWAPYFSADEYGDFLNALDNYFKKRNIDYFIESGGVLKTNSKILGFDQFGLMNVSQMCKLNGKEKYDNIVEDFFETMKRSVEFEKEFQQKVTDYEFSKKYLGVRLYHEDYTTQVGKELTVGKDFGEGVYAMLVYDLPDTVINVQPSHLQKWSKSFDEVFKTGLENIKREYPVQISVQEANNIKIWFANADHFFAPNIAYHLEDYPELLGSKGSLIGIPHRHTAIIYPINDLGVTSVLNLMIFIINSEFKQGPGSISDHLFWYYEGRIQNLQYNLDGQKLQFFPSEEFISVLNTLEKK